MPLYEYRCDQCGEIETDLRSIAERNRTKQHVRAVMCNGDFFEEQPDGKCGTFRLMMSAPADTFPGASKW
jgi:hypothetical protein